MESNDKKARYIATLAENVNAPTVKALLALLDELTNDVRKHNDTATTEEFLSNKGKISAYKDLKTFILYPVRS